MTLHTDIKHQLGEYIISTDKSLLDIPLIHTFLSKLSYWAQGRSYEVVKKSIEQSLCFGVYIVPQQRQVGFARVITDYATFAWFCDVFIVPSHRGLGLGKWLIEYVTSVYPDLQGLQRFVLATRDAHELYIRYGFQNLSMPDRWLARTRIE